MVTAWPAGLLLTVVFVAAGLGSLPLRGRVRDQTSTALHLLMCAALIAMTWWPEPAVAVWFQTALFGCAVIWFALAALGGPVGATWPGLPRLTSVHHALMAGGMIWMLTALPAAMRVMPARPAAGAMPAMSPPAMSPSGVPTAVVVVSVLLTVYFALAAIPWLVRVAGPGRHPGHRAAAGHAAMSVGMAAMLLAML